MHIEPERSSRLNLIELSLMDSRLRRWAQHVELHVFQRLLAAMDKDVAGTDILDAGCGNGNGLALLAEAFAPRRLVGVDLMPEQIARARARGVDGAEVQVGDLTNLAGLADASFDAVFVFAILHHVPAWRVALVELARVLRPGGVLLVEELHGDAVAMTDRYLHTEHPSGAWFDWPMFRAGLADAGLSIAGETNVLFSAVRAFAAVKRAT